MVVVPSINFRHFLVAVTQLGCVLFCQKVSIDETMYNKSRYYLRSVLKIKNYYYLSNTNIIMALLVSTCNNDSKLYVFIKISKPYNKGLLKNLHNLLYNITKLVEFIFWLTYVFYLSVLFQQ